MWWNALHWICSARRPCRCVRARSTCCMPRGLGRPRPGSYATVSLFARGLLRTVAAQYAADVARYAGLLQPLSEGRRPYCLDCQGGAMLRLRECMPLVLVALICAGVVACGPAGTPAPAATTGAVVVPPTAQPVQPVKGGTAVVSMGVNVADTLNQH